MIGAANGRESLNSKSSDSAREWAEGWKVVMTGLVGFSFFSIMTYSISVFMEPLSREFGWSRTLISSGVLASSIVTAVLSPFCGMLIDRYGARRLALPGVITTALAIAAFSLASGSPRQWLLLWMAFATVSIAVKTTVWTSAVAGLFTARRGLALGVMLCGLSVAQTVLPPLATWLIDTGGWRNAYIVLAAGWGGLTFLLSWFFLFDAHDKNRAARASTDALPAPRQLDGLSIAQAWRDPALWRIAASTLVLMTVSSALLIHQIGILTDAGVSRTDAAWLASLAGVSGVAGKLLSGFLVDRFRASRIAAVTFFINALAFGLILEGIRSPLLIVLAMMANGYSAGTKIQICSYLTAQYGGLRHFGAIFGLMNSLILLASGVGPVLAGMCYDTFGNYEVLLVSGTVGCLACTFLILGLPQKVGWNASPQPARAEPRPA